MNIKRVLALAATAALVVAILVGIWVAGTCRPGDIADSCLAGDAEVPVNAFDGGWWFDGPGDGAAMVFYPGARVMAQAYAPLMREVALRGVDCCLIPMPLCMPLLDASAVQRVMAGANYDHWYLAGHSLGGATAAIYAAERPGRMDGLILLAAYPIEKLPDGLAFLSVYGSLDGVLNMDNYRKYRGNWPANGIEAVIEGGNHAGFADYGAQRGDHPATVPAERQRQTAADMIAHFCLNR